VKQQGDALAETMPQSASGEVTPADIESIVVLPEATRLGRFIVVDQLGAGGFSVVYRAFDPQLNRVVAIKLLHAEASDEQAEQERRERLLREAQALARVSHPNIVTVHDVGTHDDEVFLAMELAVGVTVRDWVRERNPSVRDIVEAFCGAAAGLAAAHDAGLVHRDIKPANMIIGEDGSLKVLDFGLARASDGEAANANTRATTPRPETPPINVDDSHSQDRLLSDITREGVVIGTPAYMAPEQHLELKATGKSDQFSLCVSLYEALYGEQPFEGQGISERRRAIIEGRMRPAPRNSSVPRRLRAIVLRGLSARPEGRYEDMRALRNALRDYLDRRRRVGWTAIVAAAVAVAVSVTGFALLRPDAAAVCSASERHVADMWTEQTSGDVQARLIATQKPHALDTFHRLEAGMRQYTSRWANLHRDTCRATHVFGEQSAATLDRKMRCLERGRAKASHLLQTLQGPNAGTILDRAVPTLETFTRELSRCVEDGDGDAIAVMPPSTRQRYDELRREYDRIDVLKQTGLYSEATPAIDALKPLVVELGVMSLVADTFDLAGTISMPTRSPDETEREFRTALEAAARIGDARRQLKTWTGLIRLVLNYRGDVERAEQLLFPARLTVESTQNQVDRLRWLIEASDVARVRGDYDESLSHADRGMQLLPSLDDVPVILEAQANKQMAMALTLLGRADEAMPYSEREYELLRDSLGERHPKAAYALNTYAKVLAEAGRLEDASARASRATKLLHEAFPEENFAVFMSRHNYGVTALNLGRLDVAREQLLRARDGLAASVGPDHPHTLTAEVSVAALELAEGNAEAAERAARAVTERLATMSEPPPSIHIEALDVIEGAQRKQGKEQLADKTLAELATLREPIAK